MKGRVVLIRAYGMKPFVGRVFSEGQRGLRVASSEANVDDPNTPAAGVPWDDAFKYDRALASQLSVAADSGDEKALAKLWEKAKPLRSN